MKCGPSMLQAGLATGSSSLDDLRYYARSAIACAMTSRLFKFAKPKRAKRARRNMKGALGALSHRRRARRPARCRGEGEELRCAREQQGQLDPSAAREGGAQGNAGRYGIFVPAFFLVPTCRNS